MKYPRQYFDKEVASLDLKWERLGSAMVEIHNLIALYGPDATIMEEHHQYNEGTYLAVIVKEPESDEAYAMRVAKLKKEAKVNKLASEERDAKEYARLQKKFGTLGG